MAHEYLEIVELDDGSFALQRMDGESEPLVLIDFSPEVKDFFKEHKAAIAKAMIGAGVQAASALSRSVTVQQQEDLGPRTLH
jgi:hypothetical protein